MRIGVLCSGGDAPGMNACIRAVVRSALVAGHEVVGILRGYQGLLDGDFYIARDGLPRMTLRCVSNIIGRGGTILQSSRCQEFRTSEGLRRAVESLRTHHIEALIPIGGDGTFRGAVELAKHWSGPIVGCPGTIDNDLCGSDFTIGFSTAVATAVESIDKLRDTADSHEMLFLVEVMGRHNGYIALYTALGAGAEVVCLPETPTDVSAIIAQICLLKQRGKTSIMLVVAEGDEFGGAHRLQAAMVAAGCPYESRVLILGHLQRGGSPTPEDRLLGSRLGEFAVRSVLARATGQMAGEVAGRLVLTPFETTFGSHRNVPSDLVALLETMAN